MTVSKKLAFASVQSVKVGGFAALLFCWEISKLWRSLLLERVL